MPQRTLLALAAGAGLGLGLGIALSRWWSGPRRALTRARHQMREIALARAAEDLSACETAVQAVSDRSFPMNRTDTALLIIDMQTDFLLPEGRVGKHLGPVGLRRMQQTVDAVEKLLTTCRAAGMTIAHSRSHRYGPKVLPELLSPLDETYQLHPRLREREGEIVVDKFTFGAFASTELEQELRRRGVSRILLAGVLTNVCVFSTVLQAIDRFFRVCVIEDACAAFR